MLRYLLFRLDYIGLRMSGRMRLPDEGFGGHSYPDNTGDANTHSDPDPISAEQWDLLSEAVMRKLRERSNSERNTRKVSKAVSDMQSEVADDDRVVFSVTVTYKYETTGADLAQYYDTRNLSEAAEIDRNNLQSYPEHIAQDLDYHGRNYEVRVSAARFSGI